jgi:transcriptional regulator with XRE-family HTH domain
LPLRIDPQKLREAGVRAGYRREGVAVETDSSARTIDAYELGTCVPSVGKLLALAALYGVAVEDLVVVVPEPEQVSS